MSRVSTSKSDSQSAAYHRKLAEVLAKSVTGADINAADFDHNLNAILAVLASEGVVDPVPLAEAIMKERIEVERLKAEIAARDGKISGVSEGVEHLKEDNAILVAQLHDQGTGRTSYRKGMEQAAKMAPDLVAEVLGACECEGVPPDLIIVAANEVAAAILEGKSKC